MERKKILWLASWYPNKNDAFDGDFIQRHARAAAIHNDIHVIYVGEAVQEQPVSEDWNFVTGLTEQFVYFRKSGGFLSGLRKQNRWQQNFRRAIRSYISKNGQPDAIHVHVAWKA